MLDRLRDRVCVIGGVAGPLGEAVAQRFEHEGGLVVGVDKTDHRLGRLPIVADLADEEQVERCYERIWSEFGRVDVVYNNAGLVDTEDHSAVNLSLDVWNRILTANLTTTFLSCKHGIPYILRAKDPRGSIINTSSFLAGMGAESAQMAFNAAKAGVDQLSRDLGVHLARKGVRVNSLALGPIETPQLRALFDRIGADERERRFIHMPLGRFGTIDEFAATVAYLASDDSGFVTASSFPLNGGIPNAFTVQSTQSL